MKYLRLLANTQIFFYSLIWLMFLLILGTIAQKNIGLYLAQKTYFSSFIYMLFGYIPTPGGYGILVIIFINLLAKTITQKWEKDKIGIIIIHIASLLLLIGSALTAIYSKEGNMVIREGQSSNYISDYNDIEFVLAIDNDDIIILAQEELYSGNILYISQLDIEIEINNFCRNCQFLKGQNNNIVIKTKNLEKNIEDNIAAINLTIRGPDINIGFNLIESVSMPNQLKVGGQKYNLTLRAKRTYLPFNIYLKKLTKELHPGTNIAGKYSSDVIIEHNDMNLSYLIEMNEPLRYNNYSFFQSSLIEEMGQRSTILAVVQNPGRIYPYIASIMMCVAMFIHLIQTLIFKKK